VQPGRTIADPAGFPDTESVQIQKTGLKGVCLPALQQAISEGISAFQQKEKYFCNNYSITLYLQSRSQGR